MHLRRADIPGGRVFNSRLQSASAVSSDVADTIEGLMPQLMDIFCADDEVVRFDPVGDIEALVDGHEPGVDAAA